MKGYKIVTKENKGYNDFQYKVGETYTHDDEIKLCESGFHFGLNIPECLQYNYDNYDPKIHNVLEISATGTHDGIKGDKYVTNRIYIEKLLSEDEIYKLCTGKFNLHDHVIYYKDGNIHRDDGPAIEDANGDKYWFVNGKRHRDDGPAIEDANGDKKWYKDGEIHREDGPAYNENGTKKWLVDGKYHREDGPAIEFANGDKSWCINGKLHREDGPAVKWTNGDKNWYINGKLHREDGPAVEYANGTKEWWINGVKMNEYGFAIQYPNQKDSNHSQSNNINKCEYPGCTIYVIDSTKCYEHYFV